MENYVIIDRESVAKNGCATTAGCIAAVLDAVREEIILLSTNGEPLSWRKNVTGVDDEMAVDVLRWLRNAFNQAAVAHGESAYVDGFGIADAKYSVWNDDEREVPDECKQ